MSEDTTAQPGGDSQEQQQPQEAQGAYIPPMTTEEALEKEAAALAEYNKAKQAVTPNADISPVPTEGSSGASPSGSTTVSGVASTTAPATGAAGTTASGTAAPASGTTGSSSS